MKRIPFWAKAAAAVVVIAVLAAGAGLLAAKALFPEPKARAWVIDAARRQLGRDVRLERIDVGLRGLSLRGLEVSEKPDFAAGAFLRVEDFRLRPSWRALLRRKLVVAAVSADGVKVRVVKDASGRFNFETLASSAVPSGAAAPAKPSGGEAAPELNVRRATVSDGSLEYRDQKTGASWRVDELALDVSDFGLAEPFDLKTSLRVRGTAGARPVDARIAFDGRVDLARGSREKFKADIRRLSVAEGALALDASGRVARLDAPETSFDAAISAEGKTLAKASGTARVGETVDADVVLKIPELNTILLAKLVPRSGVPALDLPPIDASLKGRFAPDRAEVSAFRVSWPAGKIEGAGSARDLKSAKPAYDGRAAFSVKTPEVRPGQHPFLKLPPKAWLPAAGVDGELTLTGEDAKISSLTIKTRAGTVALAGVVRRFASAKPAPDVSVSFGLDLPSFKTSDLPVAVSAIPPTLVVPAARLDGGVKVSGEDVRLEKIVVKTAAGTVRLDGAVAKALAGLPQPDVTVGVDLSLPAFSDRDLPLAGVPPGLRVPPSQWRGEVSYSSKAVKVKSLRLITGRNDVELSGSVTDPSGRAALDVLIKCRGFVLDELTQLTPQTRDMKLGGSGFFALSVTGRKDKPLFAGKMQFKGLGATVAGLPLSDFTGTASFDEKRIDVPNLIGKIADATLKADITVKDYSRAPELQFEAGLDRFDLGRYLAAKTQVVAQRQASAAAKPKAEKEAKPTPINTRGHLEIGTLIHPSATASDIKVGWELRGVGADLHELNGDARLHVGGGKIHSVGDMATQSKLVKVLVFPLLVVQKIGRVGGIRLFPDFNDITLNQIVGDYVFNDGLMTLRQSEMDSDAARVSAQGTIDLPAEKLDLVVTAQVANVAPIDVAVTGPVDSPKTKVNLGKFLADPAKQLIEGLLRKQ